MLYFFDSLGENFTGDIYPKCYFADERLIILENLVADKGCTLLGKQERHSLEVATYVSIILILQPIVALLLNLEQ